MIDQAAPTPHLWSSSGQRISCRRHMPEPGTAAWWGDRWRLMSPDEQAGFARAAGHPPGCEACEAIEELARLDGAGA